MVVGFLIVVFFVVVVVGLLAAGFLLADELFATGFFAGVIASIISLCRVVSDSTRALMTGSAIIRACNWLIAEVLSPVIRECIASCWLAVGIDIFE